MQESQWCQFFGVIINRTLITPEWCFFILRVQSSLVHTATTLELRQKHLMRQRRHAQSLELTWWMWPTGIYLVLTYVQYSMRRPVFCIFKIILHTFAIRFTKANSFHPAFLLVFVQIRECVPCQFGGFKTREVFLDWFFQHRQHKHFQVDHKKKGCIHTFQCGHARYGTPHSCSSVHVGYHLV